MSRRLFSNFASVFGFAAFLLAVPLFASHSSSGTVTGQAGMEQNSYVRRPVVIGLQTDSVECAFAEAIPEHGESTVPKYAKPPEPNLRALVEITLLDFNKAVQSRDFSLFHATIADQWKAESEPSVFSKGFSEFLEKNVDISRIEGLKAVFEPCPRIDFKYDQDVLFVTGVYETEPLPVRFSFEYILDEYEWKLVYINVSTRRKDADEA